jgi:2-keto-4-pentenoate hydratase/2-oxohepta-3-ene-1,7-dioic acid hydratase in catechol pathway
MKLVTFVRAGGGAEEPGILRGERVLPLREAGFAFADMNELIVRASREELDAMGKAQGEGLPLGSVRLLAPIPRPLQDLLCLGLNYSAHAAEAARFPREALAIQTPAPIFFSKRVHYAPGSGEPIPAHADLTEKLDFENELAVVIGRDAKNVPEEEVADYIFGYTIVNDVTARDVQTGYGQWYFGKSLDGFTPMGPCIATADEFAYPPCLAISSTVNGQLRQNGNTGDMIHDIDEIVSELSQGMTLKAGTVIATGTPKGVAMGMGGDNFLRPGDVVSCFIEGIGELTVTMRE